MSQIIDQYYEYDLDQYINEGKEELIYAPQYPCRIDSIRSYYWSEPWRGDRDWYFSHSSYFSWDASGEYLQSTDYSSDLTTLDYNAQNRLVRVWDHFDYDSNDYYTYFLYGADYLASQVWKSIDYGDIYYDRDVYGHDAQGRLTSAVFEISTDSLNWEQAGTATVTYHPADTSTGEDYIQYLSHHYLTDLTRPLDYTPLIGMILEAQITWEEDGSIEQSNLTYTYDANNHLIEVQDHSFDAGDWDYQRLVLEYDANGNLQQCYEQWREEDGTVWYDSDEKYFFIWETYSPAADESAPALSWTLKVWPNPFAGEVWFEANGKDLPPAGRLSIFNLRGQLLNSLTWNVRAPLCWDGCDASGRQLGSGIYLYRLESPQGDLSGKLLKIK